MRSLPFLDGYSGETTAQLLALAATHRVDSIVLAFEQAIAAKHDESLLSVQEKIVLAVEAMERDVNNGGFAQLFYNCPEVSPVLLDALSAIGCPKTMDICAAAMEHLGVSASSDAAAVQRLAEKADGDEQLHQYDQAYYDSGEDVARQLFEFIRDNQDSIVVPGSGVPATDELVRLLVTLLCLVPALTLLGGFAFVLAT